MLLYPFLAKGEIIGTVVDDLEQPIYMAQVVAFNNDSTVVENVYTAVDGVFILKTDNIVAINVSAFGYNPCQINVSKGDKIREIKLLPSTIELGEITVSAHKPITKLYGGALVTNVSDSYLSQLGTANDVLRWVPTVSGNDGNFSVFGKGVPVIYINGRRISNSTELEQLYSNNIKDITVISNPGVKYGASVKSVIIIKTKKPQGEGFGLNARVKGSFGNYFNPLTQFNLTYRVGGFDVELGGFMSDDKYKNESRFMQNTYLMSNINERLNQTSINDKSEYIGKLVINYQINPKHNVGGFYRFSLNDGSNSFNGTSNLYKNDLFVDSVITRGFSKIDAYGIHSSNIYYNGTVGAVNLDFNMDYYSMKPSNKSLHHENSLNEGDRNITSKSQSNSQLLAQKFIATYNLTSSRIEVGEEFTRSNLKMRYANVENIIPSNWNKIKENNIAFFCQYTQVICEKVQAEAGLRYEHVDYNYVSETSLMKENKQFSNLFPSLGLSSQFGAVGLSLSYSNKTERPTYAQLDGNVHYVNRYQIQRGNPKLKSAQNEVFEFMAQCQPAFLQVSFQNQKRPVISYAEPFGEKEDVNLISYINGNTIKKVEAMAGLSMETDNWDSQISTGIAKQWFNAPFMGEYISLNIPIGIVKWDCYVKLPQGFRFMCDYTFQTKGNMQNCLTQSHSILNITLFKSFCKGKFDIRVSGKDLLNGNNDKIKLYSGNVIIQTREIYNLRACEITFRYHLNVPKNKYKGKGAGATEKERMQ